MVVLFELLTAIDNADFPVSIAIGALLFGRVFAKLEDLGVVHVGDVNPAILR